MNIATDSRISWTSGTSVSHYWDQGKKIFASKTAPLVVAYVDDVLFPTLVLPGLIDRIDRQVFRSDGAAVDGVLSVLRHGWRSYPAAERRPVTFYVGYRTGEGMTAVFRLVQLSVDESGDWEVSDQPIPNQSACLKVDGSGRSAITIALDSWQLSSAANTSRAVFSGFVDAVVSGVDPKSGGAPQLGSLYRVGPGRLLGIVHNEERYFAGARLIGDEEVEHVEWRNSLFERTDGRRKSRLPHAQAQPRPEEMKKAPPQETVS
ncbi:hypothetical protein [Aeromicrobium piscarium]|uniref:Uncharacterized protein n=1 Tax=Aeromicrobium piscarium TaxID=2590901 RepID=A0A554RVM6_9ACTN|nr:hypothetical protein [Aeromicrobium piscarium]TSD58156.1 hypothetical protein FNM00_14705 [Aeromicrobium piscarium]